MTYSDDASDRTDERVKPKSTDANDDADMWEVSSDGNDAQNVTNDSDVFDADVELESGGNGAEIADEDFNTEVDADSSEPPVALRYEREVRQESRETLRILEMRELTRDAKRDLEANIAEGATEVEFYEKGWKKRARETVRDIERVIDALPSRDEVQSSNPMPNERGASVQSYSVLTPAASGVSLRPLDTVEREAIVNHVGGEVLRARLIYRTNRGQVVEVEHRDAGGKVLRTILSVLGKEIRDLSAIRDEIDRVALPASMVRVPPRTVDPAPVTSDSAEDDIVVIEDAAPEVLPEPEVEIPVAAMDDPVPESASKSETASEEWAAPGPDAPVEKTSFARKLTFGRGKKDAADAKATDATEADAKSKRKKGKGGFLKRK